MPSTPNLGMQRFEEGQTRAEVTANEMQNLIDGMGYFVGISTRNDPPSAVDGDWYLISTSPTGAWVGKAGHLARFYGRWRFIAPRKGLQFYDQATSAVKTYNGTSWS